jgi:hypothetical protein
MGPIVAIPAVIFFAAGIALFVFYERLVKRQYEVARDAWEADGRPPGFAWAPPGTSTTRSWTRGKAMSRWIRSTPAWIEQDAIALSLQRRMRPLWFIGVGAWLWIALVTVLGWHGTG